MSRPVIVVLGVLVLVVGIGAGIGLASLAQDAAGSPVAVVSSPTASPAAPSAAPVATPATTPRAPTPSPTQPATPSPVPTPSPAPTPVTVPAPLTGLPVSKKAAARHVAAIMVDDLWAARPQSGLSQADVVWHAPAEGGIPRYMALFQTREPRVVGPIRSARLYYVAWAAEWKAAFIHAGGSPQAIALLNSAKGRGALVYNADWSPHLYRVSYRSAPNNAYMDAAGVRKTVRASGAEPVKDQAPVWKFAPAAPREERPSGGKLVVPYRFNVITYAYDRKTNTYRRSVSVEGRQFDVGPRKKVRIAPTNVIVMQVPFIPIGDRKGRLDGKVTGSGKAWIATNGKTVKGTWRKKSFSASTRFYGPDGRQVTLTMGQTFIQVVPTGTRITVRDGKVPEPVPAATAAPSPSPTPAP